MDLHKRTERTTKDNDFEVSFTMTRPFLDFYSANNKSPIHYEQPEEQRDVVAPLVMVTKHLPGPVSLCRHAS